MDATAPHTPDAALRFRACRKWLVRLLVFTVVAGAVAAGVCYQRWTNPAAMRRQVSDKLAVTFQGVAVSLDSAQLRLLGGIAIRDLRLTRGDDPDKVEFLYVPTGVIYHDKEQLAAGKLAIRKVELYRPRLRVVRGPDGKWNLAGLLAPSDPSEHVPTVVIHQGTVLLEDRQAAPGVAPVELKDVNLTLMNDRLPLLTFEGSAKSDLAGAVALHGTRRRKTEETAL